MFIIVYHTKATESFLSKYRVLWIRLRLRALLYNVVLKLIYEINLLVLRWCYVVHISVISKTYL